MNQSKKILAALVAIPVSVILAGEVQAAEATFSFEIQNDFTAKAVVSKETITLSSAAGTINSKIAEGINTFTPSIQFELSGVTKEVAKTEVENVFKYLKNNLELKNPTVTTVENAELYGVMKKANVSITEIGEGTTLKSSISITFDYLADATTLKLLENPNLISGVGINESDSPIKKIMAVHDYLINSTSYNESADSLNGLNSGMNLSAHSYAMWTYLLLNKFNITTKYVYGLSDGKYHSWNIVKIGDGWYHLDVTKDKISSSDIVSYQNFLTKNSQVVILGESSLASDYESYDFFKSITNSIQVDNFLFYVDEANGGKVNKVDLANITTPPTLIANAMTTKEHIKLDSTNKVLYFINHGAGNLLYQILPAGTGAELVINEAIKEVSYNKTTNKLTYMIEDNKSKEVILTGVTTKDGFDDVMVAKIVAAVNALSPPPTSEEKKDVIALYYSLTDAQKSKFKTDKNEHYQEYLKAVEQMDQAVLNVMNEIAALSDSSQWTPEKIQTAYTNYTLLGNKQAEVTNVSILQNAKKQLDIYNDLNSTLAGFIGEYGTDDQKNREFYVKLDAFYNKYKSLETKLKSAIDFRYTDKLESLVVEKSNSLITVNQFVNKVKMLDENHEDYLTSVASLKPEYNTLKINTKLISLMSTNDISLMEEHILTATEWQKVIDIFTEKNYMTFINTINNDSSSLSPNPIELENITKANEIYDLIKGGLKPSQWKAILASTPSLTSTMVEEKIDGLLARIKDAQTNLNNAALKVQEKIKAFDTDILDLLKTSTDPKTDDYKTKLTELQEELVGLEFAGSIANLEIILSMIDSLVSNKWVNYKKIYSDIDTVVNTYNDKIKDVRNITDETVLDQLIKEIDELDPIYKIYLIETEKLADAKKQFVDIKDKADAQVFLNNVGALLLKNSNPSTPATYEDAKTLWDEYETKTTKSVVFKTEVEGNASFKEFIVIWEKLKAVAAAAEAEEQKIKDLIEEIKSLTSDSTKDELEAVKVKYEALSKTDQNKVTNYNILEKLLADVIRKEEEATAEASKAEADPVNKLIANLTDESTPTEIGAARAAYNALSAEAKKYVTDKALELLEYYEERLEKLKEQAQKEAEAVINRIDRITNTYTENQIKSIRNAYNALSLLAKDYVTNLQKLIDAEAQIIYQNTVVKQAKLEAAAFDEHMAKIDRNSTTQEIAAARALYNRLSAEARKHVVTYDKLVRLETMWKDPEYLELVYTYYPEYIHAIKPGGIEVPKQNYDPLYIPDDSERKDVANFIPTEATWSSYEEMTYQNGRYVTKLTSSQVSNVADRTMTLKADDIEIVLPVVDLKGTSGTVGVSVGVTNDRLNIQFTEGNNPKYFSEYVEIRVPMSALKGNASQMIERVESNNGSAAVFKVEGSDFIIRTKSSGIFRATTSRTSYSDLGQSSEGMAIRELAKRGVTYNTTGRFVQIGKHVTRADAATLIAKALDLSSPSKTKYQDLGSLISASRAQGLLEAGIMSGITANRFGTNSNLTKQEAAIIIANIYRYLNQDLSLAYNPLNSNYTDVSNLTFEARQSIAILELFGVADGKGEFNPNQQLTRGQFAELFYKSLRAIDFL